MKKLGVVALLIVMLISIAPFTQAQGDDFDYWVERLNELRENGSTPEEWAEVMAGLQETNPDPQPAETTDGWLARIEISASTMQIVYPEHLGGGEQEVGFHGQLELFIESEPADSSTARMWIVDAQEEIEGLTIPLGDSELPLGTFVFDYSMLDFSRFGEGEAHGYVNLDTGAYQLTYAIQPTHPALIEAGIEDPGYIQVEEQGTITFSGEEVMLETSGSWTLESGILAGTRVMWSQKPPDSTDLVAGPLFSYPQKGGTGYMVRSVQVTLDRWNGMSCAVYEGYGEDPQNGTIGGNGVKPVMFAFPIMSNVTVKLFASYYKGHSYNKPRWATTFNGLPINDYWWMIYDISPFNWQDENCSMYPSHGVFYAEVPL